MAQKGLRSPFRQLAYFADRGLRAARIRQPNSGIQQEEARNRQRFPSNVNKERTRVPRR